MTTINRAAGERLVIPQAVVLYPDQWGYPTKHQCPIYVDANMVPFVIRDGQRRLVWQLKDRRHADFTEFPPPPPPPNDIEKKYGKDGVPQ